MAVKYKKLVMPEESGYGDSISDQQVLTNPCWVRICIIVMGFTLLAMAVPLVWMTLHASRAEVCLTADCVDVSAYILRKMNQSVDPCTDFYTYACGGWESTTFIPPNLAKYSTFAEVNTNNAAVIKRMLDDKSTVFKGHNSSSVGKLKTYYRTCMNVSKIEADGTEPIQKIIKEVGSWSIMPGYHNLSDDWSLETMLAKFQILGFAPLFTLSASPDQKNSSRNVILFAQSGLTLNSCEKYNNSNADVLRKGFLDFAVAVGRLLGGDDSTLSKMEAIYSFENNLATIFMKKEELIDPGSTYNLMTVAEFQKILGNQINIKSLLTRVTGRNIEDSQAINIATVRYFKQLGPLLSSTDNRLLQDYMVWHMVQRIPGYLPQAFVDAAMLLNKAELGITEVSPRWQRCVGKAADAFGFSSAALYVDKMFPPDSRDQALKILGKVREEFVRNLETVQWMDEATKEKARQKVAAAGMVVGYPDWILDPSKLDDYYKEANVQEGEFLNNYLAVAQYEVARAWKKYDEPPKKDEWDFLPSDVNAFFSITHNQIVVLAGLLQRPFFDPRFPLSFAYGAMGSISGHELTHGFDNTGRQFDEHGNMVDWWTNASSAAFKKHALCMVDQYSRYTCNGQQLNGEFTLGENIADNGGLKLGYRAFQRARSQADGELALPGITLSPEQLYFVGFAQIWCAHYTPEYVSESIVSDEHGISKFRVLGSVSNMAEFADVFHCTAASPLNPRIKCSVW